MKIALLGYGRMGKAIESIALDRGHEIVVKIDEDIESYSLNKMEIDVAIDFSIPDAAYKNITSCFKAGIPVISGTTGWLDNYDKAVEICNENKTGFIYASNFSLGVNIFFELNKKLAALMKNLDEYDVKIEEIHHTKKLDAPSGTAISLADQIIETNDRKKGWDLESAKENEIPILAKRIDDIPGTHIVSYSSKIDDIEIIHTAHSREGFAKGAVIAAEWIKDKEGEHSMKDVLSSLLE
ncbi:4-hydroxy-tetrahydrodipicolinate reductase [Zunongwangia endophytica]|uniref:4-hydroxy-tetrahydrodipicolinate reductase n=1 Tax=Zunongwangia endophytica TaxID=1808945 RepID=A0ABV8H6X2_9FLAO|nr:4-hydroxy-tetrahydrodipicolinate reductase [Zunongwangia endophytica]MDN3594707.1 4-hydroxy-tetrahydrodipicolinate reductase [Zunongwangia endophytica]